MIMRDYDLVLLVSTFCCQCGREACAHSRSHLHRITQLILITFTLYDIVFATYTASMKYYLFASTSSDRFKS